MKTKYIACDYDHNTYSAIYFLDSFEVQMNGKLIYSKLEEKKYPDLEEIVEQGLVAANGGEPQYVEYKQPFTGKLAYLTLCLNTLC